MNPKFLGDDPAADCPAMATVVGSWKTVTADLVEVYSWCPLVRLKSSFKWLMRSMRSVVSHFLFFVLGWVRKR